MKFIIFNYSRFSNENIEEYLESFLMYLNEHGIMIDFKISFVEEEVKDRFKQFIYSNKAFINAITEEFNTYIGELTNFENTQNYKVIFIGQQLKPSDPNNLWGEAQFKGTIAVIKEVKEKILWHEIAHLLGADDHYNTETHEPLDICKDSSNCIMTYGKSDGRLCSGSIKEITKYFEEFRK